MDWNRGIFIISQVVVVVVLGVLVGTGHDSGVSDALLAISGSLAGTGVYQAIKGKAPAGATK